MTIDKTWRVMNDLEEAFSDITTIDQLATQLQEAVDTQDKNRMVDVCLALNAFIPVYIQNWDSKFRTAWDEVIGKPVLD